MDDISDLLKFNDSFDDEETTPPYITCNQCGEEDLHWEHDGDSYRLYDEDGDRHICEPNAKGFEAL